VTTSLHDDEERETKPGLPAALLDLFRELDRARVGWALIRPREGLVSPDGDIDILIVPSAIRDAEAALERSGFLKVRRDSSGHHALAFDPPEARFLWVHIQHVLEAPLYKVDADKLLDDIRREPIPEIAPEWLMWTLLLRAIAKRQVAERYADRLCQLAAAWKGGPVEVEKSLRDHGLDPKALVDAASKRDWNYITSLNFIPAIATDGRRNVAKRAFGAARRFLSLFGRGGMGLSVAVIGPDGAGKSTLVEGLERTLPLRTHTIYMGLTGGKLQRAQALRVPGLVFAATAAVLWIRYLRGRLYQADGQVVLFERYALDGAVPSGMSLSRLQKLSRSAQRWILPNPDLVLLLDASGHTMFGRKGEYSPATLEVWRAHYQGLEDSVRNLVVIDAEQPREAVLRDAQNLIWKKLFKRRSNRGGA